MKQSKHLFRGLVLAAVLLIMLISVTACGEKKKEKRRPESFQDYNSSDMTLGVVEGYIFDSSVHKNLPNANVMTYSSRDEAFRALANGEIDGVADDEPVIRAIMRSEDSVEIMEGYLEQDDYGFIFPKNEAGEKLSAEFNQYLKSLKDSGELAKLDDKWFGKETFNKKSEDIGELTAEKGTLKFAFEQNNIPFAYISAGKPVGYEIDIIIGFCKEMGYGLEPESLIFTDMLEKVAGGDYDIGCGAVTITEERGEKLCFSDPDYSGGISICRLIETEDENQGGLIDSFTRSFRNAFIAEKRYKQFFTGIGITVLITLLTIIIGTQLGLILYCFSRKSFLLVRGLIKLQIWILYRIPVIMIIMLCYYLYYRDLAIGGIVAAVIGFVLVFSTAVYRLIERHVRKVGGGALEDDYRLEAVDTVEMLKILFEERGSDIKEDFKELLILLIKATTVAGYVAVQDMTRTFETIRKDSLEIMLPLAATTIVYFILISIVSLIFKKKNEGMSVKFMGDIC